MSTSLTSSTVTTSSNSTVGGTLNVTGATTLSSTLNVTGSTTLTGALTSAGGLLSSVSSPMATGSSSTASFYTFPSVGVYLALVSNSTGSSSSTIQTTDNLTRVWLVIVSASYQPYLYSLGNSSTSWFNLYSTSGVAYQIGLTVSGGSFTYNLWTQKIF